MDLVLNKGLKRAEAEKDISSIYLFTDSCDRTSGAIKVSNDSSYSKRFKMTDLCHPLSASALYRGLENAFPVTVLKEYKSRKKWNDEDFKEFKKVIDDDIKHIKKACVKNGINRIVFPKYGLLNRSDSDITISRTPKLFCYILKKEKELKDFKLDESNK